MSNTPISSRCWLGNANVPRPWEHHGPLGSPTALLATPFHPIPASVWGCPPAALPVVHNTKHLERGCESIKHRLPLLCCTRAPLFYPSWKYPLIVYVVFSSPLWYDNVSAREMVLVKNRSSFLKGEISYNSLSYQTTHIHTSLVPKCYIKYMLHKPKTWASTSYYFPYWCFHAGLNKSMKKLCKPTALLMCLSDLLDWAQKYRKCCKDWSLMRSPKTDLNVQAVTCLVFKRHFISLSAALPTLLSERQWILHSTVPRGLNRKKKNDVLLVHGNNLLSLVGFYSFMLLGCKAP